MEFQTVPIHTWRRKNPPPTAVAANFPTFWNMKPVHLKRETNIRQVCRHTNIAHLPRDGPILLCGDHSQRQPRLCTQVTQLQNRSITSYTNLVLRTRVQTACQLYILWNKNKKEEQTLRQGGHMGPLWRWRCKMFPEPHRGSVVAVHRACPPMPSRWWSSSISCKRYCDWLDKFVAMIPLRERASLALNSSPAKLPPRWPSPWSLPCVYSPTTLK